MARRAAAPLARHQPELTQPERNARLTALVSGFLLVLLAAIGVTIVDVRQLLTAHYFIGFLLIPPLLLKFASTGWRFASYYLRDPAYRAAGPPRLELRLLGPVLVLLTVAVFASGIELWLFGLRFGTVWIAVHKVSFLLWFAATTLHVLGHLSDEAELALDEARERNREAVTRGSLVLASLLVGAVLALACSQFASPFVLAFEPG